MKMYILLYICNMINLFEKIHIKTILQSKVDSKEIAKFKLSDNELLLGKINKKNKVSIFIINLDKLSGKELIKILWKPIPKNMSDHFKIEIRNIKLRSLLNNI